MDEVVNDVAHEQKKVGGSQKRLGSKKKDVLKEITNKAGICDEDTCDEDLDDPRVLQQLHKDVIASMVFDNLVEVVSNDKVSKIDITYDATFEVAASNLKEVMSRVVE
ncbi:hypothetical protein Q3G72_007070 [Acer saccharum]|nr:hypothetical protein Q3G72_007070 [Acer saccharum]